MRKLQLRPSRTGYSAAHPDESVYTQLDGGLGKLRRDQLGASSIISASWTLNSSEYQYFMAMWRLLGSGSSRFLLDLVLEGPDVVEHEVQFVPGSLSLSDPSPDAFTVTANLEVLPLDIDPAFDDGIVTLYELHGSSSSNFLERLAQFANVDLDTPALNP